MGDALKVLPFDAEKRVKLMLGALRRSTPTSTSPSTSSAIPITVSWESDPDFLGAFKGNLPGHYRYQRRMFCHFKEQEALPPHQRGLFLAGDDISWTAGWVEGAVQHRLNAVWGVLTHLGGSRPGQPGPRRPAGGVGPDRAGLASRPSTTAARTSAGSVGFPDQQSADRSDGCRPGRSGPWLAGGGGPASLGGVLRPAVPPDGCSDPC